MASTTTSGSRLLEPGDHFLAGFLDCFLGLGGHVLGLVQTVEGHFWNMNSTVFPKPKFRTKMSVTMRTRVVTTTAV